jgi:DNA-directed RNA polymerase subunit M/transcription elongation factor TFIIS
MTTRDLCPRCQSEMTVVFEGRRRTLMCPKCEADQPATATDKPLKPSK